MKVATQTITAPIVTALLYLLIFGHALEDYVQIYPGVGYTTFLVPGLVMMSLLQNSFANSSSSLIQSKINGSLVFILLAPISHWQLYLAYMLAAVVRGLIVATGVFIITVWFAQPLLHSLIWILFFAFLGSAILGTMGIIAGIWADKYDQLASFQNFLIMPATFLSGVFYTIHSLPAFWQRVSEFNPFFYLVDGFRYGFFGHSDVNPWTSFCIVSIFFLLLALLAVHLLQKGYKLRF
ncbi:ABC transporter permease [Oxalobacter aliiformigenes]|uniref:Transport permease protein n=2 Tax=Oxalobacter aliiformigenes TaxID=2946593 RepID=A0A9E9LIW5_9BURK|nr:ABC transporter permease [Oxalobacter aliiformigenes]WAV91379.1 ABC transporter permease [Oxalobacter aliiformigenes]WAV93460.1 ABC transporter permease [Oxalobacter aliiformigenes]WAV95043.1 ABC transporter permease [Oxalobacter aliiformigenes]WAV97156.1 ABC transporter permease [Oxalobacter aliiformigenes]